MPGIDPYPTHLASIRGISAAEITKLKRTGVTTNEQLLAKTQTDAQLVAFARQAGLSKTRMREAVNRADLVRLDGLGGSGADLFELAGVNSVKELSRRNPQALTETLKAYANSHRSLGYRPPSGAHVARLVENAKQALSNVTPPTTTPVSSFAKAQVVATVAMRAHLENVLFGTHPEGASFRSEILTGRTAADRAALKHEMLGEIPSFFSNPGAEQLQEPDGFTFMGRWLDLYTEVSGDEDRRSGRGYVEID